MIEFAVKDFLIFLNGDLVCLFLVLVDPSYDLCVHMRALLSGRVYT